MTSIEFFKLRSWVLENLSNGTVLILSDKVYRIYQQVFEQGHKNIKCFSSFASFNQLKAKKSRTKFVCLYSERHLFDLDSIGFDDIYIADLCFSLACNRTPKNLALFEFNKSAEGKVIGLIPSNDKTRIISDLLLSETIVFDNFKENYPNLKECEQRLDYVVITSLTHGIDIALSAVADGIAPEKIIFSSDIAEVLEHFDIAVRAFYEHYQFLELLPIDSFEVSFPVTKLLKSRIKTINPLKISVFEKTLFTNVTDKVGAQEFESLVTKDELRQLCDLPINNSLDSDGAENIEVELHNYIFKDFTGGLETSGVSIEVKHVEEKLKEYNYSRKILTICKLHILKNKSLFFHNSWLKLVCYLPLALMKQIAQDKQSIAFFCPTKAFRSNFGGVPRILESRNLNVFYLYGSIHNDRFEKHKLSFYIGGPIELGLIDFLDSFVTASIMDCLPSSSIKILIDHLSFAVFDPNIQDTNLDKIEEKTNTFQELERNLGHVVAFLPNIDLILSPSNLVYKRTLEQLAILGYTNQENLFAPFSQKISELVYQNFVDKKVPRKICVLKTGYPKLDKNLQFVERNKAKEKIIIYAPTPNDPINKDNWLPFMSINNCAVEILQALCAHYPEYKIVFKPYDDEKADLVKNIVAECSAYDNFILDSSGSQYMALYAKSSLLVSDLSSTAFSYALATANPVVFFSPNEEILQQLIRDKAGDDFCSSRELIGEIATTIEELTLKVDNLLRNKEDWAVKIESLKTTHCFNVGSASDSIAEAISCFLNNPNTIEKQLPLSTFQLSNEAAKLLTSIKRGRL